MAIPRQFARLRHDHGYGNPKPFELTGLANGDLFYYDSSDGKIKNTQGGAVYTAGGILGVGGTNPELYISESDQAADKKRWRFNVSNSNLVIETRTDANGAGIVGLSFVRGTTTAISHIQFGADIPVRFRDSSGADYLDIYHDGTDALLRGTQTTAIRIQPLSGENSIVATGNGSVLLYYDNALTLQTDAEGIVVRDGSGDDPHIQLAEDSGTLRGSLEYLSAETAVILQSLSNGHEVEIRAPNASGTVRTGLEFDPDQFLRGYQPDSATEAFRTALTATYGTAFRVNTGGGNGIRPVQVSRNRNTKSSASTHGYTMAQSDFAGILEKQGAGTFQLTFPLNSSTAIETGFETWLYWLSSGSNLDLIAATGVTIRVRFAGTLTNTTSGTQNITTVYNGCMFRIWKRNTDDWVITEVSN